MASSTATSLGQLFDAAHERLNPVRLADSGGVTARRRSQRQCLVRTAAKGARACHSLIQPCRRAHPDASGRGEDDLPQYPCPSLLALRSRARRAEIQGDSQLREWPSLCRFRLEADPGSQAALLETKAEAIWKPLLAALKQRDMLPQDWRKVVRLGLFLCPTLVMNLRAGATSHNPTSSLIGHSVAMMVGSEPDEGEDLMTRFLATIDPEGVDRDDRQYR